MADNPFVPVPDAIKQKLSEGRILEAYTFAEIDRILPSRFLRGSDWDSLNLTSSESINCGIAFNNLCLLAWEKVNLSTWQIESELEKMVLQWAEKNKDTGKAILRDILPKAKEFGWQVRFGCRIEGLESW